MTLKQLEYAVMTARIGNMTEAARRLYLSQPSLTHALHTLEEEMGIVIFQRGSRGVSVTPQGEEFLRYARQILEQTRLLQDKYLERGDQKPSFSVSCQHYAFAVAAFSEVIRQFDSSAYDFTLRETRTHEIIEDVSQLRSEIGVLYLSDRNRDVLNRIFRQEDLVFQPLLTAKPHVFIGRDHPLAGEDFVTMEALAPYPYISYEQGEFNSFYFSEEILSSIRREKNIHVRDRASLFDLVLRLNGYTVCSGELSESLRVNILSKPLAAEEDMQIGTIRKKQLPLSRCGEAYLEALRRSVSGNE